jgi:hypothetical protein
MLNNHLRKESGRILRLNWGLTGDPFRPLISHWSLHTSGESQMIGTPGLAEVCNAAVMERCETFRDSRARKGTDTVPYNVREIG